MRARASERDNSGWLLPSTPSSTRPSTLNTVELSPFAPSDSTQFASDLNPHPGSQIATCFSLLSVIYATLTPRFFSLFSCSCFISTRRNPNGLFICRRTFGWKKEGREGETHTHTHTHRRTNTRSHTRKNRQAELSHTHISLISTFPFLYQAANVPTKRSGI